MRFVSETHEKGPSSDLVPAQPVGAADVPPHPRRVLPLRLQLGGVAPGRPRPPEGPELPGLRLDGGRLMDLDRQQRRQARPDPMGELRRRDSRRDHSGVGADLRRLVLRAVLALPERLLRLLDRQPRSGGPAAGSVPAPRRVRPGLGGVGCRADDRVSRATPYPLEFLSWIGYYRGPNHHYVCPLPTLVIRWTRKSALSDPGTGEA